MKKAHYYYVVVYERDKRPQKNSGRDQLTIFTEQETAEAWRGLFRAKTKVISLPAKELHALIKKHANK